MAPRQPTLTWFTLEEDPPELIGGAAAVVGVHDGAQGVAIVATEEGFQASAIRRSSGHIWDWIRLGLVRKTASEAFPVYTALVGLQGWDK